MLEGVIRMPRILIPNIPSCCLPALLCWLRGTVTDQAVLWAPTRAQSLILLGILGDSISAVDIGPCAASWLWTCQAIRLLIQCRDLAPWRGRTIRESALLFNHTWRRTWQKSSLNHWLPTLFRFYFLSTASYSVFFLTEILCSLILNWCLITVAQNGDIHWQYSRGDQCLRGLLRLCTVLPPLQCQGLAEEISFPCYSYPLVTFPYSCVVEVWVGKQWRRPCALCSVFPSLFGWHQRSFRY